MEFNRLTLLGEYDPIYMCMLKERGLYKKDKSQKENLMTPKEVTSYMVAHINRGVIALSARVKNQEAILYLIKEQNL